MHDMFKYDTIRDYLIGESCYWEDSLALIENIVNVTDIKVAYPKNLYSENLNEEKYILFFCRNLIHILNYKNGKDFTLVTYNSRIISKLTLSCKGQENAALCLKILEEEFC